MTVREFNQLAPGDQFLMMRFDGPLLCTIKERRLEGDTFTVYFYTEHHISGKFTDSNKELPSIRSVEDPTAWHKHSTK